MQLAVTRPRPGNAASPRRGQQGWLVQHRYAQHTGTRARIQHDMSLGARLPQYPSEEAFTGRKADVKQVCLGEQQLPQRSAVKDPDKSHRRPSPRQQLSSYDARARAYVAHTILLLHNTLPAARENRAGAGAVIQPESGFAAQR